jgi:hypothetical protein
MRRDEIQIAPGALAPGARRLERLIDAGNITLIDKFRMA